MRALLLSLLLVPALSLGGCAQADPPVETVRSEKAAFNVSVVAEGLSHPWSLAFLPDGDMLVSERDGRLQRIRKNGDKTDITGIPAVSAEGQGGLLGLAVSPDFNSTRRIYLAYAGADEDDKRNTEVAYGTLNNNRLDNVRVIFRAEPKTDGGNHYGGRLLFGPDGMLYVTLGERFDYRDQAQNTDNHIGTLVRLHPDGRVPADNPYPKGIYTYGHRNVQGIAIHPQTQDIWTHEHGPRGGDEINIIKAGSNYGWPLVSGGNHYWGSRIAKESDNPDLVAPLHNWTPSIAPSGMAFYTGDQFPAWKNNLFVGALAGQHLRRLEIGADNRVTHEEELLKNMARIRDVRMGPDGALYLLTDEDNGRVLKLTPAE